MSKEEKLKIEKAIKILMELQQNVKEGQPASVTIYAISPIIRNLKALTSE